MDRTLAKEFESELNLLLDAIHFKYGYDFRHYSRPSMKRTLVTAMNRMACPSLPLLQEKILLNLEAFYDLLQSITISVSELFRDPSYFFSIREKVIPLLKTYPSIKVWVAGCSTGEEVYSLAILLQEADALQRTTLYATDINPRALDRAKRGVFPIADLSAATHNYLKAGGTHALSDYYTVHSDTFKFDGTLTHNVTFADHSLVTDAVFSETHLISCRNVLIYFDRQLQDKVLDLFQESLCRKGFLGLGSKETLQFSKQANNFDPIDQNNRIYQKKKR